MIINKAYKFRIYPNKEQEILIAKTIGCSRFVFNHFLAKWNDTYKETGKGLSYGTCSAGLPLLKKELLWLKEVDSIALQSSVRNLADSFDRFFKKQNQAPRFKSKRNRVQSYTRTENIKTGHYIAGKLQAGTVWINDFGLEWETMPFGGYKKSGVGREMGGEYGLENYTEVKSVFVKIS